MIAEMTERAYLIAGAGGMLGTAMQEVLADRCVEVVAPSERNFDITDEAQVLSLVSEFAGSFGGCPELILINAAAYTNVEKAEDEPEKALLVNAAGPALLARVARDAGIRFVHVSTDFVFDGRKNSPYAETDVPNPLSVYGSTKLEGERLVLETNPNALIVRTAWVFGANGVNFPTKVLTVARERGALSVVTDEKGSPTYTIDLARGILGLLEAGAEGLFHLAGRGDCSRYELASEVLRLSGLAQVPIEPVLSSAFTMKAERPKNSVLDCGKAASLGVRMPSWRDALARFLAEAGELA